jgi:hypothetical protein
MNRDTAIGLPGRLHKAQNESGAGGPGTALQQLLAPNITWTVPGDNRIAGTLSLPKISSAQVGAAIEQWRWSRCCSRRW